MAQPLQNPTSATARFAGNLALAALLLANCSYAVYSSPGEGLDFWDAVVGLAITAFLVVNVLRRPDPVEQDSRWWVWIVCAASLFYFFAFQAGGGREGGWQWLAYCVMLLRHLAGAVGCLLLGISFSLMPARRQVRVGWPYSMVRHPIYAAYIIGDACFVVLVPSLWNATVWAAGALLFAWRAKLEERVLRHDEGYAEYRGRTPWRFLPGIY